MKKQLFILVGLIILIIASCSKEESEELIVDSPKVQSNLKSLEVLTLPDFCNDSPTVFELIAGQTMDVGSVTIGNDEENLYITYETVDGWMLDEIHLFIGDLSDVPVNKQNTPVPGHFPYKAEDINATSFTLEIPLADIDSCFVVLSHAAVVKDDKDETAWGWDGDEFNNFEDAFGITRWGYFGEYCKVECEESDPMYLTIKSFFKDSTLTNYYTYLTSDELLSPYSSGWCPNLGLLEIAAEGDYTYDLLVSGYHEKIGTAVINVTTTEIIVTLDLDDPESNFYKTYMFYGTMDELSNYGSPDTCPNYTAFPITNYNNNNIHQIIIAR